MLILTGVFVTLLAVLLLMACSFGGLFFIFNRVQATADELALVGARKLNEQDRLGQMNNMIARSRQLVFDANKSHANAQEHMDHLAHLSQQLYEDSREGALLLESERVKLKTVSINEARGAIAERFEQIKEGHALVLPWLQVSIPATPVVEFGCAKEIRSNVAFLKGLEELESEDSKKYVISDCDLYKENINAKLPGSDGDLFFRISSLPAPVQKSVAPARAILAKQWKPLTGDDAAFLSSVVKVEMKLGVSTGLGAPAHQDMKATGTAVATGGETVI